ncbi:oxidoreductase [Nonomuraea sp. NPDC049269]|uniref:oxidoreductase n=1 Tax=Nonomuraea sp. NPDC049269 TaxID=3364349 RepID=UPI003719143B
MAAKICLVTGASAGIGHATALELLRAGHTVYGVARRVDRMEDIRQAGGHTLAMDVTKEEDLERVVSTVLDEQPGIDVLVNNAGVGVYGAAEDVPIDSGRHQFEVNLFGPARLIQLVLPRMRERGAGTIVNVSSIGGVISLPLGGWYHASKHALEGYTDTLRQEVGRFGIKVVLIEPGLIKTEFESSTPLDLREVSGKGAYAAVANAMADRAEQSFSGSKASDPALVAQCIRAAIESTSPKPRYAVGYLAKLLLRMNCLLPDRTFDKLVTRT